MRARTQVACAAGVLCVAGGLIAHVRLKVGGVGGPDVYWLDPTVDVMIDPVGSDDITDGSHLTALRNGFDYWSRVSGSAAELVEVPSNITDPCTDWTDFATHIVFFDETNCSGYFPGGSSTVAITPIFANASGRMVDADVIFNGSGFSFTTSDQLNRFDVQDVGTHELGHLLGLDHSGWAGATMYPYVDRNLVLHRSLSLDDEHGMRDVYTSGSHGSISGTVRRLSDNSTVAGAHVWVRDASGRTSGGTLSGITGLFTVRGPRPGDVHRLRRAARRPGLRRRPPGRAHGRDGLRGHGGLRGRRQRGPVRGLRQPARRCGRRHQPRDGDDPAAPPRGDGRRPAVHRHGLRPRGRQHADGPADPTITISGESWFGNSVSFTLTTPGGAAPGHIDLIATNSSGDVSMLPAAAEIVPPEPTVSGAAPNTGTDLGGTALTITGTGFRPGARVVIGSEIYVDGQPGGCTVVNGTKPFPPRGAGITGHAATRSNGPITTPPTSPGPTT